jgi:hypothetical protein
MSSILAVMGSYSTNTRSDAKFTEAFVMPGTLRISVRSMFMAQLAQVIPVTGNSIVAVRVRGCCIGHGIFSLSLPESSPSISGAGRIIDIL